MKKYSPVIILISFVFLPMGVFAETTIGKPFSNGIPACVSCHSISAAGFTTSAWGPDLSTLFNDFGGDTESIKGFIRSSGIEAMDAVYANAKIPENELNVKIKSFSEISSKEPVNLSSIGIYTAAGAVFVIFLIFIRLFFRQNNKLEENR